MAAGASLNQLSGLWVTGAPPFVPGNAGVTLNQLTGVWITGASTVAPVVRGISLNQLLGVWITGSGAVATQIAVGGWYDRDEEDRPIRRDDDLEVIGLLVAFLNSV